MAAPMTTHNGRPPAAPARVAWPWLQVAFVLGTVLLFIAAGPKRTTPVGVPMLGALFVVLAAVITVVNVVSKSPARRAEWSLLATMAVTLGVPVGRLPHNRLNLYLDVLALVVLAVGALACRSEYRVPRGLLLVSVLFGALFVATALAPDSGGLKQYVLVALPAVSTFLLTGRLSTQGRQRVAMAVVSLGVLESVMGVIETAVLRTHIWVQDFTQAAKGLAVATQSQEEIIQPNHLFGVTLARAQGTFAHPLPLGLLLLVSLALTVRYLEVERRTRILIGIALGIGLIFAGDRNTLLMAAFILAFLSAHRLSGTRAATGVAILGGGALVGFASGLITGATVSKFAASGSYTHRIGAYQAIPKLFDQQSPLHVLLGNGVASTRRIFALGLLQNDNLPVIDNQYVAALTHAGVIGLTALILLTVLVFVHAPREWRPAVLSVVFTLLIFDTLLWPSATVLTMFVFASVLSNAGPETTPEAAQSVEPRVHPAFRIPQPA